MKDINSLSIDLRFNNNIQSKKLYAKLIRLKKLENLEFLSRPNSLDQVAELLNQLATRLDQPLKFQIQTKDNQTYNVVPNINSLALENLSGLRLHCINTVSVLDSLLCQQSLGFPSLKVLKLGFMAPDLQMASYLKHIQLLEALEILSLNSECWSPEFSTSLIQELRVPISLKYFKLIMLVSLKDLVTRNKNLINLETKSHKRYPWRDYNLFEEEPLLESFYRTMQEAKSLIKIYFEFQIIENFNPHYTNFFISLLKRIPKISSFSIHVVKHTLSQHENEVPGYFDMALLLNLCSRMRQLEKIEVYMPNLLFDNAKISSDLVNSKEFNIGLMENEGEPLIKFKNIARNIRNIIDSLASNASNLTSLVFDFTEVIDEKNFFKRFTMIEKFRNLEVLGGRFMIQECSPNIIQNVGRVLRSLKKLKTVVIGFLESHKCTFDVRKYLAFHKSTRDVLITFNETAWMGHDDSMFIEGSLESESVSETWEIDFNEDIL